MSYLFVKFCFHTGLYNLSYKLSVFSVKTSNVHCNLLNTKCLLVDSYHQFESVWFSGCPVGLLF